MSSEGGAYDPANVIEGTPGGIGWGLLCYTEI